ncbi:extracellular solute-binding protein [Streptomyces sp. NPDC002690]
MSSAPRRPAARHGTHRRTAAVVVASLIGPLAACGGHVGRDENTLRITANVTDRTSMDAVIAAFGKLDPEAKVSVTYAETDQLQENLAAQLASGDGPDLFTVSPGNGNAASVMRLQAEGRLYDLSARRFAVDLPEDAASVVQVKYHTFAARGTHTRSRACREEDTAFSSRSLCSMNSCGTRWYSWPRSRLRSVQTAAKTARNPYPCSDSGSTPSTRTWSAQRPSGGQCPEGERRPAREVVAVACRPAPVPRSHSRSSRPSGSGDSCAVGHVRAWRGVPPL